MHSASYDNAVRRTPIGNVALLHDGTLEGLLSSVFEAYVLHEVPEDIVAERIYQPRLCQSSFFVETNQEHAQRVRAGVIRKAGHAVFVAIVRAAASDEYGAGMAVYRLIDYVMSSRCMNSRHNVLDDLSNPVVAEVVALGKHVVLEAERMRQFIRFSHLENGVWFARCNPNAAVVPFVMGYFAARLNTQPFMIYDENHHVAGVYNGHDWLLVADKVVNVPSATADDALIEQLWRRFYDSLSIQARYNPELRCQFMPVRLWKNLPELKPMPQSALSTHFCK